MAEIPLFPLSNALFPAGVLHLRLFEVRYLDMIRRCLADGTEFGVVVLLAGREVRTPEGNETLAAVGTMARILRCEAPMPALLEVACMGTTRFRLASARRAQYGLWMGEARPLPQPPAAEVPHALQPSADALGQLIAGMQRDGVPAASMPVAAPFRLDDCGWVADRWAELLPLPPAEKARLLETDDPVARLRAIQQALQGLPPAPDGAA